MALICKPHAERVARLVGSNSFRITGANQDTPRTCPGASARKTCTTSRRGNADALDADRCRAGRDRRCAARSGRTRCPRRCGRAVEVAVIERVHGSPGRDSRTRASPLSGSPPRTRERLAVHHEPAHDRGLQLVEVAHPVRVGASTHALCRALIVSRMARSGCCDCATMPAPTSPLTQAARRSPRARCSRTDTAPGRQPPTSRQDRPARRSAWSRLTPAVARQQRPHSGAGASAAPPDPTAARTCGRARLGSCAAQPGLDRFTHALHPLLEQRTGSAHVRVARLLHGIGAEARPELEPDLPQVDGDA